MDVSSWLFVRSKVLREEGAWDSAGQIFAAVGFLSVSSY